VITKPTPTTTAEAPIPAGRRTHPLLSRATAAKPQLAPVVDLFAEDDTAASAHTPVHTVPPAAQTQTAGSTQQAVAPTAAAPASTSNIFDLDFHAPTASSAKPNPKADIMSLFPSNSPSTAPPSQSFLSPPQQSPGAAPPPPSYFSAPQNPNTYASWNGSGTNTAPPAPQAAAQSPIGNGNGSGWGGMQMDQGGWGAQAQKTVPAATSYGASTDPWAASGGSGGSPPVRKEDRDPFANIWQ